MENSVYIKKKKKGFTVRLVRHWNSSGRGCGISILGDIKNKTKTTHVCTHKLTGHSPVQPALVFHVVSRGGMRRSLEFFSNPNSTMIVLVE